MPNRWMACALAIAGTIALGAHAHAEIRKFINISDGKMIPSFQLVATPPKGWIVDEEASRKNGVQMMVPKGKTFRTADALIYVMVTARQKDQNFSKWVSDAEDWWRKSVPDTRITKLPDIARANGKAAFQPYQYENPSRPQQAFEFVAFGEDGDKDGNTFNVKVVITGRDRKAIERASSSYTSFLNAH